MPIDVTSQVTIARSREEVAAFVSDPANDLAWIRALSASTVVSGEPPSVGGQVNRVAKMMGRRVDYTTEVIAHDPGRLLDMQTVEGPFAMHVTYQFEDAPGGGTLVRVRNRGGSGPMFAVFGWLIGRMVKSRVDGDLAQLKRALEAEA